VLVRLPFWITVVVDAFVWAVISAVAGWWGVRLPADRLDGGGPVEASRYRRWLRIGAWKDRLPEAGTLFGGVSKRTLPPGTRHRDRLLRFARESRRAELTHAAILATTPAFLLWNPPGLFAAMVAFAAVANLPCLAVARFNRGRVQRALRR
jgi:glycosyl-4,4'-diaponeurosporenoate acyltransferase